MSFGPGDGMLTVRGYGGGPQVACHWLVLHLSEMEVIITCNPFQAGDPLGRLRSSQVTRSCSHSAPHFTGA